MRTYLVTGGAGFIGSHLTDALLAAGHRVRVLDDLSTGRVDNIDHRAAFLEGDIADARAVRRAMDGVDGCFHLAAIASVARGNEEWLGTHRTNLTGAITVFDAAREGRIPVVYASSAAVYGDVGDRIPREDFLPMPRTAYGADKLGCEHHGRVAHLVHGVPTLGLRFFNVYGPRQDPLSPYSGVISIFARLTAEAGELTVHGDGQQTRDFVYVGDVVAHLIAAMRHLDGEGGAAAVQRLHRPRHLRPRPRPPARPPAGPRNLRPPRPGTSRRHPPLRRRPLRRRRRPRRPRNHPAGPGPSNHPGVAPRDGRIAGRPRQCAV